jgi:hypothetical protein
MDYKKIFLTIVTIVSFNSCGGGGSGTDNTNETEIRAEEQDENQKTTVNNEAINFPKSSNQSETPTTEELSKN